MTRVNVYLPDQLAEQAKAAGVNLSALTQGALRSALAVRSTDVWLSSLPTGAMSTVSHDAALSALDAAREEPSTRHG